MILPWSQTLEDRFSRGSIYSFLISGLKIKTCVERVVATLLVVIFVVKNINSQDIQLPWILENPEREITCKKIDGTVFFMVDRSIAVELGPYFVPVIDWLEKQEQDLPPLYSTLEMGRNKRDFAANLAKIFY